MTRSASHTAQSEHEQIVRNVLASLNKRGDAAAALNVLAWERQALHLALRRDYDRSDVSYRGTNEDGVTLYAVTADSHPGARYHVEVHPIAHPTCSCLAGQNGKPCKHSGVALAVWAEDCERARRAAGLAHRWAHLTRQEQRDYCEMMAAYYDGMEA